MYMKKIILLTAIVILSCKKKDDPQPANSNNGGATVYGCMNPSASNYNPQATSDACNCPCTFLPNP